MDNGLNRLLLFEGVLLDAETPTCLLSLPTFLPETAYIKV